MQNLEESSLIINKIQEYEVKNKVIGSSISLNGSETTVFHQIQNQFVKDCYCCMLAQKSKSVANLLPY